MASSLSNLVINLTEGIDESKFKYKHDDKKHETCGIKYKDCKYSLRYTSVVDDLVEWKCLSCNNNCQKKFDEKEDLYSHLNMENITDVDYTHAKRACKDFEVK